MNHPNKKSNELVDPPYDIIREPSPMISDSGETSSERGGMMQALAAAAANNDSRSPRLKAVIVHEDESDIVIAGQNSTSSGSGGSGGRPPAATVNGRSPRLQGQTGALFNRADPLSLSASGPTTALNIMKRSSARTNSDTTSGSGGASYNPDGVPRSVVTTSPHPSTSATPVISNVDSRRGGNTGDRHMDSAMPPSTADYPPHSGLSSGWGGAGGYPAYANAHDIHRARWEQEQRELAADYYPSANNYPFDYYNTPGSYFQQQLNQPPPASLRYHRQHQMTSDAMNAAAERRALEHRLQVEQHRLQQEYYQPRLPHQVPPSMVVLPHQAQAAQLQQQQLQRAGQNEGGGVPESKAPARSSSPGVSSVQRHQANYQPLRSGSPGVSSVQRNQVHQQQQRSGSPGISSAQRNQVHHNRTHSNQRSYDERDWRTNQVWREDDHSRTANVGGPKIPSPPPAAAANERGPSDLPSASSLPPRSQPTSNQQQGRVSGGMTIDQYDITAQMYGQSPYLQDLQQQFPPTHVSATPSPPPAPVPPHSTPVMAGIDPRIQHQMNLMAMMFQQQQAGGIPPPHMSPIPRGLMYPPQYYAPHQHNYFPGGIPDAVGQHSMPQEVIIPNPPLSKVDDTAAAADTNTPSLGPGPTVAPPPMPTNESSGTKVRFSHLQIRTYETILGDNPSCTGGPSLSIGWRYNPEHFDSTVDDYERKQDELYGPGIRPLDIDLVLHRSERESILLKMGYTQSDLAEAVRRLNKAKSRRRQTVHNLPVMFLEEKAESCKRSLGRLCLNRQRTRHMYDDWKKKNNPDPKPKETSVLLYCRR